jgi:hypothetical protein
MKPKIKEKGKSGGIIWWSKKDYKNLKKFINANNPPKIKS